MMDLIIILYKCTTTSIFWITHPTRLVGCVIQKRMRNAITFHVTICKLMHTLFCYCYQIKSNFCGKCFFTLHIQYILLLYLSSYINIHLAEYGRHGGKILALAIFQNYVTILCFFKGEKWPRRQLLGVCPLSNGPMAGRRPLHVLQNRYFFRQISKILKDSLTFFLEGN